MKAFGLKIQTHKHNYWEHRGFTKRSINWSERGNYMKTEGAAQNWNARVQVPKQSYKLSLPQPETREEDRVGQKNWSQDEHQHCVALDMGDDLDSAQLFHHRSGRGSCLYPWSCRRHFCKSYCRNITWNDVTTPITHLQRRDGKRKRFKASCKIHEETEEPVLREGCKSLICLT